MPDEFLLSYASFNDSNRPFLEWQNNGEVGRISTFGQKLSLEFDFSEKFCTGWIDFENRCSCVCPDSAIVDDKYENCLKCRDRTGFNPAFYNATTISEQQQKINQNPHFLYLAYFAPGVVKVGISQESRGIKRLLEQGARMAIKLETFSSALIARQYEAKIAKLDGILETVPAGRKLTLLNTTFNQAVAEAELSKALAQIDQELNLRFEQQESINTEKYFYANEVINLNSVIDMTGQSVAGEVVASVGSILITRYSDNLLAYNLKKYIGYRARKPTEPIELELPSEQLALF